MRCSLEALLARPVRGCRRLDEVEDSCAWDFADRSRVFGFSGDCFSGESGSLKEAGSILGRAWRPASLCGDAEAEVVMVKSMRSR